MLVVQMSLKSSKGGSRHTLSLPSGSARPAPLGASVVVISMEVVPAVLNLFLASQGCPKLNCNDSKSEMKLPEFLPYILDVHLPTRSQQFPKIPQRHCSGTSLYYQKFGNSLTQLLQTTVGSAPPGERGPLSNQALSMTLAGLFGSVPAAEVNALSLEFNIEKLKVGTRTLNKRHLSLLSGIRQLCANFGAEASLTLFKIKASLHYQICIKKADNSNNPSKIPSLHTPITSLWICYYGAISWPIGPQTFLPSMHASIPRCLHSQAQMLKKLLAMHLPNHSASYDSFRMICSRTVILCMCVALCRLPYLPPASLCCGAWLLLTPCHLKSPNNGNLLVVAGFPADACFWKLVHACMLHSLLPPYSMTVRTTRQPLSPGQR